MAERRARQEKAGCRRSTYNEQRREQRHQRGFKCRLQSPDEWCASHERERARLLKITEARRAAREVAGPLGKRGRPIDPTSRRQQQKFQVRGARSESGAVRVRHVSVSVMRLRGRLSSHACKSRYGFLGGRPRD